MPFRRRVRGPGCVLFGETLARQVPASEGIPISYVAANAESRPFHNA